MSVTKKRKYKRKRGRKNPKGLANLPVEKRREIARLGGLAVARNKEHMAKIGSTGGLVTSQDKEHMSRIGKIHGKPAQP